MLLRQPHIVVVRLVNIEEFALESGPIGAIPDLYITICSVDATGKCYSRLQSSALSLSGSQGEWNERHIVSIEGPDDLIVINISSYSVLGGSNFVGQVVLDLKDRPRNSEMSTHCDLSRISSRRFLNGESFGFSASISGKFLLIFVCNFHVLSHLLLNYI
jgi:hypothetical protein